MLMKVVYYSHSRDIVDSLILHCDVLTLVSLKRVCTLYYDRVSRLPDEHWKELSLMLLAQNRYLRYVARNCTLVSAQDRATYLAQLVYKPNGVGMEYMRITLTCRRRDWRSRLNKVAKAFVAQYPECKIQTIYDEHSMDVIDRAGTMNEPLYDKYLEFELSNRIAKKNNVLLVMDMRWWNF
jgi:hypothetical protein